MKPFQFSQPDSLDDAIARGGSQQAMWLAGGTTLIDLMKLNVLTPSHVVSIKPLLDKSIRLNGDEIILGAGCTMAQVASDAHIIKHLPVIRQSLILAASPQIRNMATLGGNLLQRTRSPYFRHTEFPDDATQVADSSGNSPDISMLAILGHSGRMLGTYPGDFGNALLAVDGKLHLKSRTESRIVKAREFFIAPKDQATYTTQLAEHELVESISIPVNACHAHSMYLKVRDRSSYAFALASAAVAVELEGSGANAHIKHAKVSLGGIATIPWASQEAEAALRGKTASDDVLREAADAALAPARPPRGLEFKVTLAKRVLVRALQTLRDQGVPSDQEIWAFQHGRTA